LARTGAFVLRQPVLVILMAKLLFLSTSLRSVPVLASVAAHAAVAAVAGFGGHALPFSGPAMTEIAVEVAEAVPVPAISPPEAEPAAVPNESAQRSFPTHHHDYPVPPDHDAHPHDPSLVHTHTAFPLPAPGAVPDEPVSQPSAIESAPLSAEAPVFTMSLGRAAIATGGATSTQGAISASPGGGAQAEESDAPVAAAQVSVAARLLSSIRPVYPVAARTAQVEADVLLEIVVDKQGVVIDARIVRGAGYGMDESALTAIRRYRFSPAERNGRAVRVHMPWSVEFRFD
jgi:protein TonB